MSTLADLKKPLKGRCVCGTPEGVPHFCTGDPEKNGKATAWERK